MKLQKLRLKNFQRHDKFVVEFDPFVTTIVGSTNAGKSSIVRALRWIFLNRPSGDSFVRHGRTETSVTATIDGVKLKRSKGDENLYELDGKQYKAFGTTVPDECRSFHGITSVNIQRQHDSYYWLSMSAGDVAKELNEIVDLESIDRSFAWFKREASSIEKERQVAEANVQSDLTIVESTKWTVKASEDLEEIERDSIELAKLSGKVKALTSIAETLIDVAKKKQRKREYVDDARSIVAEIAMLHELEAEWSKLKSTVDHLRSLPNEREQVKRTIERMEEDYRNERGETCPTCGRPWEDNHANH